MPYNAKQSIAAYFYSTKKLETHRLNFNKGVAIGNESFKQETEVLSAKRMKDRKMGRPVNSQNKRS